MKIETKIEKVLSKIRPYIQMHGGDVILKSFENGLATLSISGACVGCKLADMTYNGMVSSVLKEEIPEIKEIIIHY
jgi:Fe-S cluster biogenesis protein NfuA